MKWHKGSQYRKRQVGSFEVEKMWFKSKTTFKTNHPHLSPEGQNSLDPPDIA